MNSRELDLFILDSLTDVAGRHLNRVINSSLPMAEFTGDLLFLNQLSLKTVAVYSRGLSSEERHLLGVRVETINMSAKFVRSQITRDERFMLAV